MEFSMAAPAKWAPSCIAPRASKSVGLRNTTSKFGTNSRHASRVGKYPGLAARLTLVFHLIEWAAGRTPDAVGMQLRTRRIRSATILRVPAAGEPELVGIG